MGTAWQDWKNAAKDVAEIQEQLAHSQGELDNAFLLRMGEWGESWKGLAIEIQSFGRSIGEVLGPGLKPYVDNIKDIVVSMREWAKANPDIVSGGVAVTGMLIGLSGSLAVIRMLLWGPLGLIAGLTTLTGLPAWGILAGIAATIAGAAALAHFVGKGGATKPQDLYKPGGGAETLHKQHLNLLERMNYGPQLPTSATEASATAHIGEIKNQLDSIDRKMTDLIQAIRSAFGFGGGAGGGGLGGGGEGAMKYGGGHGYGHGQRSVLQGGASGMGAKITSKEALKNRQETWDFLKAKGLSDEAAAGIIGSEQGESNFNPTASGDHGASKGSFQWDATRRAAILRATGINVANAPHSKQLEAMWWETHHGDAGAQAAMRIAEQSHDVGEVNRAWVKHFERSKYQQKDVNIRGGYANRALADLKGKHPGAAAAGAADTPTPPVRPSTVHHGGGATGPQSMNMKPMVDDEHLDDMLKKLERAHHLAKTMPTIKLANDLDPYNSHRIRTALNNRWASSNDVQGG
jgi:hypothetical protein